MFIRKKDFENMMSYIAQIEREVTMLLADSGKNLSDACFACSSYHAVDLGNGVSIKKCVKKKRCNDFILDETKLPQIE